MFLSDSVRSRCRAMMRLSIRLWGVLVCVLWGVQPVNAEGLQVSSTFESGIDIWAIAPAKPLAPSAGFDFKQGSAYDDHNNLNLPDASTKWYYQPVSPWIRHTSRFNLNPHTEVNLKIRADQLMGLHVDVANIDWAPSPYMGVRAGVVNFNTNWCRTYDVDSPWIAEPDVFCRRNDFMNINNAAPGLQAYTNTPLGDYQLQTIVGVYHPMLFSYETQEFGFNDGALRPNFQRESNRKASAALNLLHLQTGTQVRLGLMRSDQTGAYKPRLTVDDRARQNRVNNYYVGLDTYVQTNLRLRYSVSKFFSRDFYDNLLAVQDKDISETLELIYDWQSSDVFALGWSQMNLRAAVNDSAVQNKFDDYFYHHQSSVFVSWRHQWHKNFYSTLQWTHADQTNGYLGNRRSSQGDALGVRLSYQH